MSTINLNDSQYDLKTIKIFNGGDAGVVNGVSMKVEKRKATDADNMPAYKLILTDANGGEINKGYFGVTDKTSEAAAKFFVTEMKHLVHLVGKELPATVESYDQLLNTAMRTVFDNIGDKTFNVFVSYGTKDKPNKYLQIASAFSIVSSTEKPYFNPKAQMTKIEPTNVSSDTSAPAYESGDLPFDVPAGTPPPTTGSDW